MFMEKLNGFPSNGQGFAGRFGERANGRKLQSPQISYLIPIVFVVDGDVFVRKQLELLIRFAGCQPKMFTSAEEFLDYPRAVVPNCLVIDASLPDTNALDLQKRVASDHPGTPVIFITACIDVATTVKAMKAGAVGIFVKPLSENALLTSIQEALERSGINLAHEDEIRALRDRYRGLSRREREVMALVASGLLNKQVGGELGITERTVKAHRGQVMQKMKAGSLPHLVKMATTLGVTAGQSDKVLTAAYQCDFLLNTALPAGCVD
jgi:FixJ family two-component response regulator